MSIWKASLHVTLGALICVLTSFPRAVRDGPMQWIVVTMKFFPFKLVAIRVV